MSITRPTVVQPFLIVMTCLLLAGCQLWPFKGQAEEGPPGPAKEQAPEAEDKPEADSISRAMSLLQEGREGQAERMLARYLDASPGDPTAKLLLAQIRQPPEELLGESFEEVVVRPGDSLSAIAGRTVGNELLFYSLARLNEIDVPRLLRPGQRLLVPRLEPAPAPETVQPEVRADEVTGRSSDPARDESTLQDTARRLIRSDRASQAYALLLSAARAGKLRQSGDALLAQASVALAQAACEQDDPERAKKILNQASPWLGTSAEEGDFARVRRHVEARLSLGDAEQQLARGDHAAAFDTLMTTRDSADDLRQAHRQQLERLETALGEHYHDRALSAWRDQQVDLSIELWSRVIQIKPDFEPAIRYLERARRARQELQSLEDG